jgi:predicted NAD/FAD-dependent oxidoreductase
MSSGHSTVAIIGAGIAGLTAADRLTDLGVSCRLVEAGPGVGGRMATKEVGDATFDHGAQFFTARSPEFTDFVGVAMEAGAVAEWSRGFQEHDGYPRFRGTTGMTSLLTWMAERHDVELETTIVDLADLDADALLLTPPVPESLAILSFSGRLPDPDLAKELAAISYKPTLTVLLTLDRPPAIDPPGGYQYGEHPELAFVTDNSMKGISAVPAVTVHLSNELSIRLWNENDDVVAEAALRHAGHHLGDAVPTTIGVERWRYAGPHEVWPERFVAWGDDPIIALAGEAFGGPKVEGAFLSGRAAADALAERLA